MPPLALMSAIAARAGKLHVAILRDRAGHRPDDRHLDVFRHGARLMAIAIQPASSALPVVNFIRKSPSVVVNVPVVFACARSLLTAFVISNNDLGVLSALFSNKTFIFHAIKQEFSSANQLHPAETSGVNRIKIRIKSALFTLRRSALCWLTIRLLTIYSEMPVQKHIAQ